MPQSFPSIYGDFFTPVIPSILHYALVPTSPSFTHAPNVSLHPCSTTVTSPCSDLVLFPSGLLLVPSFDGVLSLTPGLHSHLIVSPLARGRRGLCECECELRVWTRGVFALMLALSLARVCLRCLLDYCKCDVRLVICYRGQLVEVIQ